MERVIWKSCSCTSVLQQNLYPVVVTYTFVTYGSIVTFFTALLASGCPDGRPHLRQPRPRESPRSAPKRGLLAPLPLPTCISCATPDLLLKHPDATLATYKKDRWNTWNMCLKHVKKHMKNIANIRNIQIKRLQHMCETYATPHKHTCNIRLENR